jgi:AcrR family transcriptional regulator
MPKKTEQRVVSHPPRKNAVFKQERSKVTHDALIKTGFAMAVERDFETISISELAKAAGYSVGAFYAQFRSKDELFDALVLTHMQRRRETQSALVASTPLPELIDTMVNNIVNYYWGHHVFWRVVLRRTLKDTNFWTPFRSHFAASNDRFIKRVEKELGRSLRKRELENVTFAFQMLMGSVNIAIVNQAGPVFIGQKQFIEELKRAFLLISDLETLMGKKLT